MDKLEKIITIEGNPKPLKRHYHTKTGKTFDPSSEDKKLFALQAIGQIHSKMPFKGDICLTLRFYMKRPKSHYRTGKLSRILKDTAPVYHKVKPDISNLIKFVEDALIGICYKDYSQIVKIDAEKKYILDYDDIPRTRLMIKEIKCMNQLR